MNYLIFAGVIILDQVTKVLARRQFFFNNGVVENFGLPFFGLNLPGGLDLILVLGALAFFIYLYFRQAPRKFSAGMALVLGGAVSNIADRLVRGSVSDFIDLGIGNTFNFADIAIIGGILLIIIKKPKSKSQK